MPSESNWNCLCSSSISSPSMGISLFSRFTRPALNDNVENDTLLVPILLIAMPCMAWEGLWEIIRHRCLTIRKWGGVSLRIRANDRTWAEVQHETE